MPLAGLGRVKANELPPFASSKAPVSDVRTVYAVVCGDGQSWPLIVEPPVEIVCPAVFCVPMVLVKSWGEDKAGNTAATTVGEHEGIGCELGCVVAHCLRRSRHAISECLRWDCCRN